MTDAGNPTGVSPFLGGAAETCMAAVTAYEAAHASSVRFQRYVLLALAALDECSRRRELEPADLRFLGDAAAAAAGACRTEPPNAALVAVAMCLEEVSEFCARLLGEAQPSGWRRFLYDDIDFDVLRAPGEWRLRGPAAESAGRVLDDALEQLAPSLSNYRIAEITVQVLGWYAQEAAPPV